MPAQQMKLDGRLEAMEDKLLVLQRSHDEAIIFLEKRWQQIDSKLDVIIERMQSSYVASDASDQPTFYAAEGYDGAQFFNIAKSPITFQ